MEKILQKIKSLREQKNLTQQDIADKLALSLVSYSKIERGITELSVKRLFEMATILNVSVGELIGPENIQTKDGLDIEKLQKEVEFYKDSFESLMIFFKYASSDFKKKLSEGEEELRKTTIAKAVKMMEDFRVEE